MLSIQGVLVQRFGSGEPSVLIVMPNEVRRGRRQSAGLAGRRINLTWRRARWFAVGHRLDRGVKRHLIAQEPCGFLEIETLYLQASL